MLRIYWYDGAIGGARPTTDQAFLAHLEDVKLRLGFVNSSGQQKGVDSLIVTDLIELARLKSITDAVVLSGDEDVRVGVQIAQNHGVRVHLLGIAPSRGSQSAQLLQEADTTTVWADDTVRSFLSVRDGTPAKPAPVSDPQRMAAEHGDRSIDHDLATIEASVSAFVQSLGVADLKGLLAYWETERGVPAEFDRKLLPTCGSALGRQLTREEIKHMRASFQQSVKGRTENLN